jgi:hypothetical protein
MDTKTKILLFLQQHPIASPVVAFIVGVIIF